MRVKVARVPLIQRKDDTHTGIKGSINPLLEEADIDKDGKISLSEFRILHLFEKVAIFFAVVCKHVAAVSTGLMKGEDGELSTDFRDRA
ncbi:calcium-dependent protein kinase 28-like protein [Tanacetum coccineum]